MSVLVVLEQAFLRGIDGHIYTPWPTNYTFWRRYLGVLDEVVVLARVRQTTDQMSPEQRADGSCVTFWPIPDYAGAKQYVTKLGLLRSAIREAVSRSDAYILRLPCVVGDLAVSEVRRLGKGYAVEVVGDPWDALSPGTTRTPLRPVYRRLLTRSLRRSCHQATAVSYVTRSALQARYPARAGAYVCGISDVLLGDNFADDALIENRKQRAKEIAERPRRPAILGFIGRLAASCKGADTLLKAVRLCLHGDVHVEAHFLGDGKSRPRFEAMARNLGISKHVHFRGHVPAGKAVFDFLDSIDVFVMPSRQEGLPRAMVEAMARGCPCIGSAVGSIPELLAPEALVPPSDEWQLSEAIRRLVSDSDLSLRMIRHNLDVAQTFRSQALAEAQRCFLTEVRARSVAPAQHL